MFDAIDAFIDTTLQGLGVWGPIVGCFFILIESMVLFLLPLTSWLLGLFLGLLFRGYLRVLVVLFLFYFFDVKFKLGFLKG